MKVGLEKKLKINKKVNKFVAVSNQKVQQDQKHKMINLTIKLKAAMH